MWSSQDDWLTWLGKGLPSVWAQPGPLWIFMLMVLSCWQHWIEWICCHWRGWHGCAQSDSPTSLIYVSRGTKLGCAYQLGFDECRSLSVKSDNISQIWGWWFICNEWRVIWGYCFDSVDVDDHQWGSWWNLWRWSRWCSWRRSLVRYHLQRIEWECTEQAEQLCLLKGRLEILLIIVIVL